MPPSEAPPKSKKPCQYFRKGTCAFGQKCLRFHGDEGSSSDRKSTSKKRAGTASAPPAMSTFTGSVVSRSPTPPDLGIESSRYTAVPVRESPISPSAQYQAACVFYAGGNCLNGENCTFLHANKVEHSYEPPPERQVCKQFLKGKCLHGNSCASPHPSKNETAATKAPSPDRAALSDRSESSVAWDANTPSPKHNDLPSSYRPTSPFGYQRVVPQTPKQTTQEPYAPIESGSEDGRYDDADEVDEAHSSGRPISQLAFTGQTPAHSMNSDHRTQPRVYPVVSEAAKPVPYVTDIVPHWSQFADPKADGNIPFCKQLAQNQCILRDECRFRHSLTIDEYILLFKDLQPNLWTISRSDTQNDISYVPSVVMAPVPVHPTVPSKHGAGLLKTPCAFYPLGKCNNGDHCPYAHIGTPPGNDSSSQSYSSTSILPASESSWEASALGHRSTKMCRNLEIDGHCKFGNTCHFSHDRGSHVQQDGRSQNGRPWGAKGDDNEQLDHNENTDVNGWGPQSGAGSWADDGVAETAKVEDNQGWGSTSNYAGDENNWSSTASGIGARTRSKQCFDFSAGRCRRGNNCKFGHDQANDGPGREYNREFSGSESGKKDQPCFQFKQGRCNRGMSCRYSHDEGPDDVQASMEDNGWESNAAYPSWGQVNKEENVENDEQAEKDHDKFYDEEAVEHELQNVDNDDSWAEQPNTQARSLGEAPSLPDEERKKIQKPCKAFGQGACDRGESCWYLHQLPEDQRQYHEDFAERMESTVTENLGPTSGDQHLPLPADQVELEDETDHEAEDLPDLERFMFHCTVRFNSRCYPAGVMTAADSRKILLSNLPSDSTVAEVRDLARSVGSVTDVALIGEGVESATMAVEFEDYADAMIAVKQFNDQPFGSRQISARLDSRTLVFARSPLHSQTLMVSWAGPTVSAWAYYETITLAKKAAEKLDKVTFRDRQIQVMFDRPGKRGPYSIRLTGLPPTTSKSDIDALCTDPAPTVIMLGEPTYKDSPEDNIRQALGRFGRIENFHLSPFEDGTFKTVACVNMQSYSVADEAAKALHNTKPDYLGSQALKVQHVYLAGYKILPQVFECIIDRLNLLRDKYKGKCKILDFTDTQLHTIEIQASIVESTTFSEANTELGGLVDGLLILDEEGRCAWDPYLELSSSIKTIDKINGPPSDVPCFVHCDPRLKCVRVYGSLDGQQRGKSIMLKMLKRVKEQCHEIILERAKISALLDKGLSTLQESLGTNKVSFNILGAQLIIRGSPADLEKAKLVVSVLASSPPEWTGTRSILCPLCERVPVSPVKLTCRHAYCKACLQFALSSTANRESTFFNCAFDVKGDGVACGAPLSYVVVRDNLPTVTEVAFLKAAFLAYVRASNGRFFFCPTPECPAVYRSGEEGVVIRCAMCLSDICPRCCSRIHDGSLCQDSRISTVAVD